MPRREKKGHTVKSARGEQAGWAVDSGRHSIINDTDVSKLAITRFQMTEESQTFG